MKTGSLVEAQTSFDEERKQWKFAYPKRGQILTVSSAYPHHNPHCRKLGILLLTFEEIPGLVPLSHKTIQGFENFKELEIPENFMEKLLTNKKPQVKQLVVN